MQAALQTALDAWAAVADISFTQTSQPNQSDSIDFTFRTLDGPGGTLAQGYLPDDVNPARIAGDIQFDASEVWEVGNALGGAAMDLVLTAVTRSGMPSASTTPTRPVRSWPPTISPDAQFTGLAAADVASILALYAPGRYVDTEDDPDSDDPSHDDPYEDNDHPGATDPASDTDDSGDPDHDTDDSDNPDHTDRSHDDSDHPDNPDHTDRSHDADHDPDGPHAHADDRDASSYGDPDGILYGRDHLSVHTVEP